MGMAFGRSPSGSIQYASKKSEWYSHFLMLQEVIHLRFNDRTPSRFKFRAEPPRPTAPPNEQPVAEGDGLRECLYILL